MRHKPLIFTTIFLLINVLTFLSVFYYKINGSYVSINIVLSMAQGNMIGIENQLSKVKSKKHFGGSQWYDYELHVLSFVKHKS
jgi:hypothetical protein